MVQRYDVQRDDESVGFMILTPDEKHRLELIFATAGIKLVAHDQRESTYTWGEDVTAGTQEMCETEIEKYLVNELANGDIAPVQRDDGKEYQINVVCRLILSSE